AAEPAAPAPAPAPAPAGPALGPVADRGTADSSLPLEECFSLYQDKRYADVIARAALALERDAEAGRRGPTGAPQVRAPRGRGAGGCRAVGFLWAVRAGADPAAGVPGRPARDPGGPRRGRVPRGAAGGVRRPPGGDLQR